MTITSLFFKSLLASILIISCTAFMGCTTTPHTTSNTKTDTMTDAMSGYADDTAISTTIFNDPALKVLDITVETNKGQVQLSSAVNSQADIEHALELVRNVRNIKDVESVSTMLRIN